MDNNQQPQKKQTQFRYFYDDPVEQKSIDPNLKKTSMLKSNLPQTAQPQNLEKKQQKSLPNNSNWFYQTILNNRQKFESSEVEPFIKQTKKQISIKTLMDQGTLVYLLYLFVFQQKKWFKLTSNPSHFFLRLAAIALIPSIVQNRVTNTTNYQFYKRNQSTIESFITSEQRKQMGIADLIAKYQ